MNRTIRIGDIETRQELPDDVIYYNIIIPNTTNDLVVAKYNQISQVPILNKPDDYFMAIVRFGIPGSGIPIFIFDDNTYFITLKYNGTPFTFPIIYNNVRSNHTIYSYNSFIDMINTTFQTAFSALKAEFPGAPPTEAPFMQYNSQTLLCSLYCQTSYDPVVAGESTIEIIFNNILYYFFDNFYTLRIGTQALNKQDYQFVINNVHNNLITSDINNLQITSMNPYYKFQQEYSTLYEFSDIKTISFASCLFPSSPEYAPTVQNQILSSEKILVDFEPLQSLSDPSGFRGVLQYYANGIYRLINLTSNSPLNTFDLQIYYKDNLGNTYPLEIPRNSSVSVKLAFIKKTLYKSTYAR
jgi:hypothetical protein